MTLYTTDYLEYYLTLVAWVVNNGIWSILVASGVFALPFVAIVIQEWLKARSEGADEGNKRSEEHTSELQSLMRISYAVFCLKKKTKKHYPDASQSCKKNQQNEH